MRSVSNEVVDALRQRRTIPKDFIWIEAKDIITRAPVSDGQWSDIGPKRVEVINPLTGSPVLRTFWGSGTLTKVSDIILSSSISSQPATITMSQVNNRVEALLRGYDVKQAPVQIFRGYMSIESQQLVSPAIPRFVGYIDNVRFITPSEGNVGYVELTCNAHTQELFRSNPEVRSSETQYYRQDGDEIYANANVVGLWEHTWGKEAGVVPATAGNAVTR